MLLRQALQTLPVTLRTAVVLRDLQELSYQEIAERLGLPEGTVKSRINRGRSSWRASSNGCRTNSRRRADGAARPRRARPAVRSIGMNLTTEHANGIAVVRVGESRLMYPLLSEFSSAVTQLIAAGERKVVVDLSAVGYVDSATIGCLMDLYRQASAAGGALKLAGVQKRVETMLTMTGAQNFIEVHPDEPSAVKSFGA